MVIDNSTQSFILNQSTLNNDVIINVDHVGKMYKLFDQPIDRLKHTLFWRFGKKYGRDFWALDNISFQVKKGEAVGIIGRNGSGKSTLLQIIAGVLQPTCGSVEVKGRVSALLELGSGFNPEYTGRENIYLSGAIYGINQEEMEAQSDDIIAFADIGEFIDQPVKNYSSGMFARLAFAVAMSVKPDILIVDEILAVGDMVFQAKCLKRFHKLIDNGCTILFVSHDPYSIRAFCPISIYLDRGKMVNWGSSDVVIGQYVSDMQLKENDDENHAELKVENPFLFIIDDVQMLNSEGKSVSQVSCGEKIYLRFHYLTKSKDIENVVFVFNLYRADGLYICGATSLMDSHSPMPPGIQGWVTVEFPSLRILTGEYYWRVAIDDHRGMGVYSAIVPVCKFRVIDKLESVGLIDINRNWSFEIQTF